MGCTTSHLRGAPFAAIDAASARTATKPPLPPTTTTTNPRKPKPSYSTQPGRRRQTTTTGLGDRPAPTTASALPTDADAGIVSIAASPAGNWTADRDRVRADRMAYFRFGKQQPSSLSTSTKRESLYGGQATGNEASRRGEPGRRSLFP